MGLPGNSVREIGERMNGGAVRDERSPVNVAILFPPYVQSSRILTSGACGGSSAHIMSPRFTMKVRVCVCFPKFPRVVLYKMRERTSG